MKSIPIYKILPFDNFDTQFNVEYWQKSKESYDNKEYKSSIYYLLKYINSDIFKKVKFSKDIKIRLEHGLIDATLEINNTFFKIESKVLRVNRDDKNKILTLRKVAEANFSGYDIVQLNLKDDYLYISYTQKLPLCNPEKLYDILSDFFFVTDRIVTQLYFEYDFELIKKIDDSLTIDDKKKILDTIKSYIDEYYTITEEFKDEQLENYRWDIGVITLMKISNLPYLNGYIKFKIYDAVSYMYSDNSLDSKIDRSSQIIKELKEMTQDEILKSIYKNKIFLSLYRYEDIKDITEFFKSDDNIVQRYHNDKNHLALFYFLYMKFIRLLYLYNINKKDKKRLEKVLSSLPKKSLESASNSLYKLYNQIISENFFKKGDTTKTFWYWVALVMILILSQISKG